MASRRGASRRSARAVSWRPISSSRQRVTARSARRSSASSTVATKELCEWRLSPRGGSPSTPRAYAVGRPEAQAGERERLVPDRRNPVRRFPALAPLDRRAGVEDAEPCEPGEVLEARGCGSSAPRPALPNSARKLGATRAERRGGSEGDVDLEPAREQEHAVQPGGRANVEMVDRACVAVDRLRPVPHDVVDVRAVVDTEEEVDVRPAVLLAADDGARQRRAGDAGILVCALDERRADALALLRREHARRRARRADARRPARRFRSGRDAS